MTIKQIQLLAKCQYGKYFLTKSYSIELLLYLSEFQEAEGIENLLAELRSSKPKLPAFLEFISFLESKGCIEKKESILKKSQRTISLTNDCATAIQLSLNCYPS